MSYSFLPELNIQMAVIRSCTEPQLSVDWVYQVQHVSGQVSGIIGIYHVEDTIYLLKSP